VVLCIKALEKISLHIELKKLMNINCNYWYLFVVFNSITSLPAFYAFSVIFFILSSKCIV